MTFREKRNLSFVLIGILLILVLIPIIGFRKKQPLGEYITTKEVQVLTELTAMVVGAYDEVYEQEEFASEQIIEQDVEKQTLVEQEVIELQQDNRIETTKELKKLTDSWEQGDLTYEQFHTWYTKAEELNPVMTEQEKQVGQHFDFSL